jgi:type VI secretion system protein ImpA
VQAAPDTAALSDVFARMRELVSRHVAAPALAGADSTDAGENPEAAPGVPGSIRSREDAVRSLEAVAEYFRRNEPSSPVPMFVDRAKRLIARDFLEVLAELAPDSLAEVKRVGGVRDEE